MKFVKQRHSMCNRLRLHQGTGLMAGGAGDQPGDHHEEFCSHEGIR